MLNLAYNVLTAGTRLEDIDRLRHEIRLLVVGVSVVDIRVAGWPRRRNDGRWRAAKAAATREPSRLFVPTSGCAWYLLPPGEEQVTLSDTASAADSGWSRSLQYQPYNRRECHCESIY